MAKKKAAGGFSGLRRSEREPWSLSFNHRPSGSVVGGDYGCLACYKLAWAIRLYPCIAIRQASSEIASC
jgi:hypothetical protein